MVGNCSCNDEQLMQRIVEEQDETAWARLADRYREPLVRFCASYVSDAHQAEDIAHDVLVRIRERCHTFDPGQTFRPWLYRIARNRCIDYLRQAGGGPQWDANSSVGLFVERICDTTTSPRGKANRHELRHHVLQALESLSETSRTALVLRYFNGLSTKGVAEALGVSHANARVRIFRGMKALREAVAPCLSDTGEERLRSVFSGDIE